jgi:alkaline phosphatase
MKKFKNAKRWISLALAGATCFSLISCGGKGGKDENVTTAKNIILLIGDGMGPNQVTVGEIFKGEKLTMQKFPYATKVETRSASSMITDSAAAATALATGVRTTNGVIGKDENLQDLTTIVDIAHNLGKRTGIIATEDLTGATPMGFSGHAGARSQSRNLIQSAATTSNVNFFGSYLLNKTYRDILEDAGYEKIEDLDDLSEAEGEKLYHTCIIDAKAPSMSDNIAETALDRLVVEALDYLSQDEDGFFLMAEGAHIDHGGHNNDMTYMLQELLAFDDAVQAVLEWAADRDDTVVIVTADHETGGLELKETASTALNFLETTSYDNGMTYVPKHYAWTTTSHSSTDVNFYINGANIDFRNYSFGMNTRIKNTDVFKIMKSLLQG